MGAVSRFTTVSPLLLKRSIAGGFTSHLTSHKSVFHKKYSIKGQHFVNLFSYISSTVCDLHTGSGVGASFLVSPKPSSTYVVSFAAPA